jgi:hypothetical protein
MNRITQVFEYHFPAEGLTIARVNIDFDDLIGRSGLTPEHWDEPGLGAARGAVLRLPSDRIIAIQELQHFRKNMGLLAFDIVADAVDILACGVEPLIDEALVVLDLPKRAVGWKAGDDLQRAAANIVEFLRARSESST